MALIQPHAKSAEEPARLPQPYRQPFQSLQPFQRPVSRPTPKITVVSSTLAFQVVPSRTYDPDRTEATLEAAMQSLVLDARRPVALEIASDGTGAKSFLVRATDERALEHAKAQLRAYAPQVLIRHLEQSDPLTQQSGETVSVCELTAGSASYLPLRTMEQTDPLRGLLGGLTVPADMRAITQLALLPAAPKWSHRNLRKAVEHPLEQERTRHRDALALARDGAPSTTGVVLLVIVFAAFIFIYLFSNHLQTALPTWMVMAASDLFFSFSIPHLSQIQALIFYGGAALLLGGPLILGLGIREVSKHLRTAPLYDQQMVARKTSQMAYRARLRLYVFGPGPHQSLNHIFRRYTMLVFWSTGRWLQKVIIAICAHCCYSHMEYLLSSLTRGKWSLRMRFGIKQYSKHQWDLKQVKNILQRGWHRGLREWQQRQKSKQRRREVLQGLIAAYRQFDTASANYFVPEYQTDRVAQRLVQGGWWRDVASSRHYVTSDFLSRAWYLPQATMFELPGIEQKRSRTLLLPTALIASPGRPVVGNSVHAGYTFPFAFPPDFLTQHTLLGGKSGEGKSTLMTHIARAAMETMAVCLIDPHGDLASDVLRCVPPTRRDDVVFVDLGDTDFCIGFNPLDVTMGRNRDLTVASLVETFRALWESGWGLRMEAPFRAALMTLYEANEALMQRGQAHQQYTLLDVAHLLLDESFCHDLLVDVQDIYLHRFWFEYFDPLDMRQQRERIDPVLTKMMQLEAHIARRILGQSRSTINLSECIATQKILVVRLAVGEAGLSAPLLGATILGLVMVALREQSNLPPEERVKYSIIVDEFQSIPGADYALLLAELRKFGGSAVLATQSFEYLENLNPHLLPTTLANVKQLFLFRLSAQDAHFICRELNDVSEEDILNQDTHCCYVKLIGNKQQQPTFSLQLELPALQDSSQIEAIRAHSRRYTRPATEIEEELVFAMARALRATAPRSGKQASPRQRSASYQKGDGMRHQTAQSPTVDGTAASFIPSVTPTPSGEEGITPLPNLRQTSAETSQRTPTGRKYKARPTPRVRFSKRTPPSKRDKVIKEENIISSFDLHPVENTHESEHEQKKRK